MKAKLSEGRNSELIFVLFAIGVLIIGSNAIVIFCALHMKMHWSANGLGVFSTAAALSLLKSDCR